MTDATDPDAAALDAAALDARSDPPSYAAAVSELETILTALDADHVDIDSLADLVARAAELIAVCRGRLDTARRRVEEIVATLDDPEAD